MRMARASLLIIGISKWMSLETSSRMTVSEMVIRVTPPSIPAAPTSAYKPGSTLPAPMRRMTSPVKRPMPARRGPTG